MRPTDYSYCGSLLSFLTLLCRPRQAMFVNKPVNCLAINKHNVCMKCFFTLFIGMPFSAARFEAKLPNLIVRIVLVHSIIELENLQTWSWVKDLRSNSDPYEINFFHHCHVFLIISDLNFVLPVSKSSLISNTNSYFL